MRTSRYVWLALLLLSAIVAACASYGTFDDGAACAQDSDCPSGQVCTNDGFCQDTPPPDTTASCENDTGCPIGQVCENHLCRPDLPSADGGGTDYDAGQVSGNDGGSDNGADAGQVDSGTGSQSDGGTTADGGCVSDGGPSSGPDGGGSIEPDAGGCSRDSDCPAGQVCDDGVCGPHCHGDHDGGPSGSCNDGPHACGRGKALICHVPPGNPANAHSICVGQSAVSAHLAHGDALGRCSCR